MMVSNILKSAFILSAAINCTLINTAFADGDDRPQPKKQQMAAPVVTAKPLAAPVIAPKAVKQMPVYEQTEDCGCGNVRLSGGVATWFFNQESATRPGAAAALDYWCDNLPLNFRVGVEGRHMHVGQNSADFAREWATKTTRITYIRVPFSLEYRTALDKETTFFFGGGPDIIHTANDFTETGVGMHLSARVHYAFNPSLGVSLEAGYMWGSVDGEKGREVRFDNAFVTPMMSYTF